MSLPGFSKILFYTLATPISCNNAPKVICVTVSFSKPKYKEALEEEGIQIVNWQNKSNCILANPIVVTHIDKILAKEFFAVFVCVRSEQLPAITPLLIQFPKEWPLVCFQPGFQDIKNLSQSLPGRTLLHGHPGFSSYIEKPLIYNDTNKFNDGSF